MERKPVIDVSHWDGNVDYASWINKHNLWGVIVKCGGNETRLGRYTDSQFETNYQKAKAAGLHVGAYYYTVCTSVSEAQKDAEHIINILRGHDFDMPIYMDVEDPRQFRLSRNELTAIIKTFCNALINAGYYAGLYTGGYAWLNNMNRNELNKYANWIAWWQYDWPTQAGDIGLWQQGTKRLSDGTVYYDDVSGCTDFSWCIVDYPSRIKAGWTIQIDEDDPTEKEKPSMPTEDNRLTEFCNWMYTACAVWSLGYDQYNRQDIRDGGECDCSSLVIWALQQAGFDTGSSSYTGNMSENLTARGWQRIPADLSQARPGDILLNDTYHTAAVISGYGWDAQIAQASIDERGRATGGAAGDQTGNETNIKNIYTYSRGWDCILRYGGSGSNGVNPSTMKLAVDGMGGPATVRAWQASLGTLQDGVISGQCYDSWQYFPAMNAVTWERTGSQLIREVQRKVGAGVDGYWGPETSYCIQNFLIEHGFSVGAEGADGYFGTSSVKGLQTSLNDENNPWI